MPFSLQTNYITEGSDENSGMGSGVFRDVFSAFHRLDVRLCAVCALYGQEHAFSLTYLLNLFFLHVVMVPYYEFFQTEAYSNALMSLADESGKTGNKPPENPPETSLINVNYVAWLCRKMNGTESEGKQTAKA